MDDGLELFTDTKTGESLMCGGFNRDVLHSPDGKTFYQLKMAGFGGHRQSYTMTILNPHSGVDSKIEVKRDGPIITYDGRTLELVKTPPYNKTITPIVPLPKVRVPEYLFQNTVDNTLVYVSADKYKFSYESFRLFTGLLDVPMFEIVVQKVDRYRDGGTTYVHTKSGTLFSPASHKNEDSTWNKRKLIALDPKDYTIVETADDTARITKKVAVPMGV